MTDFTVEGSLGNVTLSLDMTSYFEEFEALYQAKKAAINKSGNNASSSNAMMMAQMSSSSHEEIMRVVRKDENFKVARRDIEAPLEDELPLWTSINHLLFASEYRGSFLQDGISQHFIEMVRNSHNAFCEQYESWVKDGKQGECPTVLKISLKCEPEDEHTLRLDITDNAGGMPQTMCDTLNGMSSDRGVFKEIAEDGLITGDNKSISTKGNSGVISGGAGQGIIRAIGACAYRSSLQERGQRLYVPMFEEPKKGRNSIQFSVVTGDDGVRGTHISISAPIKPMQPVANPVEQTVLSETSSAAMTPTNRLKARRAAKKLNEHASNSKNAPQERGGKVGPDQENASPTMKH